MKIENIYQNNDETVFELSSGLKVIRRSDDIVEKLHIKKWESINFIPEGFYKIERPANSEEQKKLKMVIAQLDDKKNIHVWKSIKNFFTKLFT